MNMHNFTSTYSPAHEQHGEHTLAHPAHLDRTVESSYFCVA